MIKFSSMIHQLTAKIKSKFKNNANLQSIILLVFWAFASRGVGVVRESLVGRLVPIEADIYNAAATLNETIVTVFILGSVGAAMLPQILKLNSEESNINNSKVNSYVSWCTLILCGFVLALSLVGILFNETILRFINNDFFEKVAAAGKAQDYLNLNVIFLFAPVLFAIKTILGVFLNAKKSFKIYSLEGFIGNLGTVIGLSILYSYFGLSGAGLGLSLGFLFVILGFGWDAYRLGLRFNLYTFPELKSYLWQSLLLFLPRLFLISSARVAETLITSTASTPGDISTFRMAINIQGVFYGLMAAMGTVFLPDLTNLLIKKGEAKAFWNHLTKYLRISLFVSIGAVFVTIIGAPLILWLIKSLSFSSKTSLLSQDDLVNKILILVVIGSLSIPMQAVGEILNRYFVATQDRWRSIVAAFAGNIVGIVITYQLIKYTDSAIGVMWGFVINNIILVLILGTFCYQNYRASLKNCV